MKKSRSTGENDEVLEVMRNSLKEYGMKNDTYKIKVLVVSRSNNVIKNLE